MKTPTPRSGFRASVALVRPLAAELRALGIDADALLAKTGLTREKLDDPDTRIPFEDLLAIGHLAVEATGDPAFGLHLAEHYRRHLFGILDYLAHSSLTLGDAIRHLCRYNRLLQDVAETRLEVDGERALIWQRTLGGMVLPPGMTENSMANLIVIGRELTGRPLVPLEVHFVHAEPAYSREHARIFGAPVRFEAERDGLELPASALELPLQNADPALRVILERHARQLLEQMPNVARFSHRVQGLIAAELKDGNPSAESVARKLDVSERTLRRRLQEDETTYEQLVDGLRRDLSERYLGEPSLSIDEVGLMLGYSDVSAFRRAFRRWHGTSPAAYRQGRKAV